MKMTNKARSDYGYHDDRNALAAEKLDPETFETTVAPVEHRVPEVSAHTSTSRFNSQRLDNFLDLSSTT